MHLRSISGRIDHDHRMLRQNGPLWTEIVIWTSVIGTFLTVTGLYVGIGRIALRRRGRISPHKALWY
ncbi:hypothetical protein [Croceicoccus marinus]|uniref:Uncharacterized protein n=1 Tax=Croceicoccus marinus TaxID=450378 RepID=A0A1Z1FFX7_9SPHN|nr:hypothetical protein [Croceicoccus marinus]ARU17718.1 hypothetical protein A9D14_15210 [Croceicoccus marinus]